MPGFGLDEGQFHFFMQPDGAMQVLAVEDIGKIVAAIYAQPERFKGKMGVWPVNPSPGSSHAEPGRGY